MNNLNRKTLKPTRILKIKEYVCRKGQEGLARRRTSIKKN
jgi:hypothetical protein